MQGKEAHLLKSKGFDQLESEDRIRATMMWYGPQSPLNDAKKEDLYQYHNIFFPTKI